MALYGIDLRLFPTVFDDDKLFSWTNSSLQHGVRILAHPENDLALDRAIRMVYKVLPKPIDAKRKADATQYFVDALCQHLLKEEDLFMDETPPDIRSDIEIDTAAEGDSDGVVEDPPDSEDDFIKGIWSTSEKRGLASSLIPETPRSIVARGRKKLRKFFENLVSRRPRR
ncbi:hypothetical protein Pmar_PMAR004516 [Perkinsus marinus ATCC 50983]|uniref:Uncharacterized protein n=1 Tax=Perkinsus marinus (strain ATCC 50983 / TXsc) TaxID=423536 RepID=C5LZV9_PERM5|nr:hypothetical protein Pmar_PMAR004516 [Perkinsus marinus ATCC 50983]EEQ97777.1 hypothetical protein Pmar_PMAR004516 [Perkinsus marinus ATCC 50983]|eukprot:XP_002765060.1 hypothetical protein Pmar_PMAR004516 [Perkinsus marinus ATCC 50983]